MSASIWPCSRPFHPFTEPPPKSRYSFPFFGCFITKAEGIHAAHHIVHGYQIDFQAISSHTCICGPRCSCCQLVLVRHLCGCVSVHVCMRVCTSSINFCIVTFFFFDWFFAALGGLRGEYPCWLIGFFSIQLFHVCLGMGMDVFAKQSYDYGHGYGSWLRTSYTIL